MSISAAASRMIQIKRKQDNVYREMDAVKAANQKTLQIANFEIMTGGKIERKQKERSIQLMKEEYSRGLLERRRQLADVYNSEMEQWQTEALARVETQEDRKARIMERAFALRDAREKKQQEYVRGAYDRQWRDACDDARLLDSQAMTVHMSNQRLAQIEDKQRRKQMLTQEEEAFVVRWRQQLAVIEENEARKQEEKRQQDLRMQEGVRAQMEFNESRRAEHFQRTRQEDEAEIARIRDGIRREQAEQQERAMRERQRGMEVREFNEQNKYLIQEKQATEREHEAILLNYALRKEKEANDADEMKRMANRQAAVQYRRYLQEQMVKEAEDTAFMDEVCKREEERVWKMRDDALQAREVARQELMKQVDQGRQHQIANKHKSIEDERQAGKVFAERFLVEAREGMERDRQQQMERRALNVDNQQKLLQHVELRRQKEELEKQEAYLADKHMQHIERLHRQRLADQGGALRTNFPLKSGQWYS